MIVCRTTTAPGSRSVSASERSSTITSAVPPTRSSRARPPGSPGEVRNPANAVRTGTASPGPTTRPDGARLSAATAIAHQGSGLP